MHDLPASLFANPVWHALQTKHRRFAASAGEACRYPAAVAPFVAVAAPSATALRELHSLLAPAELVWLFAEDFPPAPEISIAGTLECLQMVLPAKVTPPRATTEILRLCGADAPQMLALTDVAFPGFFRDRTCEMGSYYGVRIDGELVAMGGERLLLDGYPEISGVCTHPAYRGRGLGASIIWQLVRDHRREGLVSWLHVGAANAHAVEIYRRLGFEVVRAVTISRICRAC
jgi:ribosomal protein S18 acetylase RimI-like enzyme